jgi:hypothetical protein
MSVVVAGPIGYSDSIEQSLARRNAMNIAKHMEAVFVTALVFAGSLSYAVENLPEARAQAHAPAAHSAAIPANMPVVSIHAKRMSAEEKAASLRAEQLGRGA